MRKITLVIAAALMGLVVTSCGPSKEAILTEVSAFFTKAQTDIQAIDNADALKEFVTTFGDKKNEFMATLSEKFAMKDNNFVGFSEEENTEIMGKIADLETEYNTVKTAKCGEILKPYIDRYHNVVAAMQEKANNQEAFPVEMLDEMKASSEDIKKYSDIVPEELATIFNADDQLATTLLSDTLVAPAAPAAPAK